MVISMKKKSQRIPDDVKSEIIEACRAPGCIVSEVAKKYNISAKLLYSWRSKDKKSNQQENKSKAKQANLGNFVELSLNESAKPKTRLVKQSPNIFLKKVSLEFNNFTFELQGNMSGKKLVQIISILEQPC